MNLTVRDGQTHRNGVSGNPFTVYLVDDNDTGDRKIVIRFHNDPDRNVAVLSVEQMFQYNDIGFTTNSWRGDDYAHALNAIGIRPETN
jgi:hypothetical protein